MFFYSHIDPWASVCFLYYYFKSIPLSVYLNDHLCVQCWTFILQNWCIIRTIPTAALFFQKKIQCKIVHVLDPEPGRIITITIVLALVPEKDYFSQITYLLKEKRCVGSGGGGTIIVRSIIRNVYFSHDITLQGLIWPLAWNYFYI